MALSTQQKNQFKGQAHALKPVIMIGHKGLTPNVIAETEIALLAHELIKIKIAEVDKTARKEVAAQLCETLKAEFIQMVGRIVTIYRENPDK